MTTSGFYPITLVDKTREYDGVHTLRFASPAPISFVPGQYVHLLAPASPPGPENVRHLSIASIPEEGFLRFTVDFNSTSEYKKKLAALKPGGLAHLFKVKGEFVLGETLPTQVVFLAGGLGITPIRALLRQIVHRGLEVDWRLMHVARESFLYASEIESWGGLQARVRRPQAGALVASWAAHCPSATYYVSGSSRFVAGITELLAACGVGHDALQVENFR